MEEIEKCEVAIEKQIKAGKKILLMLDFDGTVSPVMPMPEQAYLPDKTRHILEKINQFYPVVIISGRSLDVVKKKVGVDKFIYVGSHGLEWSIKKELGLKPVPKYVLRLLSKIREEIEKLSYKYPELLIEKKPYSVTFHYKFINGKLIKAFKGDLQKIIKPIYKNSLLRVFWDKKTIEIAPQSGCNKGRIANIIYKYFQKNYKKSFLPIYIGDAQTDEDAFKALEESGITIRVGKNKHSAAKYYIKNQKQVDGFLVWLAIL